MRFAIYVPNFGTFGHVATLVELAKAAESAGWNGFFIWIICCLTAIMQMVQLWSRGSR